MTAKELKDKLKKAIDDRIIRCKEIDSLRCPAMGYVLFAGRRCCYELSCKFRDRHKCVWGDEYKCIHRLNIEYTDGSEPNTFIDVRYRISPGVKEGFIDSANSQLVEILKKIETVSKSV